ncbi:hypothetical protein BGY98DRAFT_1104105 [Russula aff. rugulosa BPL654]|nr:hypothetical protein BGY98DRAFT_1104105 [Russula aff. rugulosa BPL654]
MRSRLIGVSFPIDEFDERCRDEIGLRLELGGELLEKEEDNMGVTERRWTEVLENASRAARPSTRVVSVSSRPEELRFKLIGEKQAGIFLYDLVDEHDQLPQCCRRHGRHHSCPQFMQAETQKGSVEYGGEVGDEGEESLEDLELYVDALRNAVVLCLNDGRLPMPHAPFLPTQPPSPSINVLHFLPSKLQINSQSHAAVILNQPPPSEKKLFNLQDTLDGLRRYMATVGRTTHLSSIYPGSINFLYVLPRENVRNPLLFSSTPPPRRSSR